MTVIADLKELAATKPLRAILQRNAQRTLERSEDSFRDALVDNHKQEKPAEDSAWLIAQLVPQDISTISDSPEAVAAFLVTPTNGKVTDKARLTELKENYKRDYGQTKHFNKMVALFSHLKVANSAMKLRKNDVSDLEMQSLRSDAINEGRAQVGTLLAANEKSSETLEIIGTSKKDRKKKRIFNEIRNQLVAWDSNLGEKIDPKKIVELKLAACQEIMAEFQDERTRLVNQFDMETDPKKKDEIKASIVRVDTYIARTKNRIEMHQRSLELMQQKSNPATIRSTTGGVIR